MVAAPILPVRCGCAGEARRVRCLVPFCGRTRGDRKGDPLPRDLSRYEWICGDHWRLVPAAVKARRRHWDRLNADAVFSRAAHRRLARKGILSSTQWGGVRSYVRWRAGKAWEACKAAAVERAMGITA